MHVLILKVAQSVIRWATDEGVVLRKPVATAQSTPVEVVGQI